jgi:transaldolase
LPAITTLIADGLNINVTLIFGLDRYRAVAEAYIEGLRRRAKAGKPVSGIASVASFFISRIDNVIDQKLDGFKDMDQYDKARALRGEVAIAGARLAYRIFNELFAGPAWQELQNAGAQPQRLLWASTSAKDPTFSEVKYVEELIGPQTVDTVPPATLSAYRQQGKPAVRITSTDPDPVKVLNGLKELGIDLDKVMSDLEDDGVEKFKTAYDQLLNAIAKQLRAVG